MEPLKKDTRTSGSGKVPKSAYLTFDVLRQYFHLPISAVGKELGVCATMLKKICRKNGIPRWPYRQIKSLNRMIASLEAQPEDDEHVQSILKTLRFKRENLLGNPHMTESLLRHRKQFRMITKKNGTPAPRPSAKPRISQANDLDDMAVAALSTLSGRPSPERMCQPSPPPQRTAFFMGPAAAGAPYAAFARPSPPGHYAPASHYAPDTSHFTQGQATQAQAQAHAHAQAQAQAHTMYALNHHQQHLQAAPPAQAYQPRYRLQEQPQPQRQLQQSVGYTPGSRRPVPEARQAQAYAPSWHLQATPPKQLASPYVQAQGCASALKLPELHLEAPAQSLPAAKLPPLEPNNAMSLKHLLAY